MTTETTSQMTGSEKQIAWAQKIRTEKLAAVESFLAQGFEESRKYGNNTEAEFAAAEAMYGALVTKLADQTSAAWWIDHRYDLPQQLLSGMQS